MGPTGRPVFGAIAGFIFFFFIGLTLMVFGVIPFDGPWLTFPLIGIVVGGLWGWWAPFNRKKSTAPLTLVPGVPVAGQVPTASAPAWTVRPVTGEVPVTPPAYGEPPPATMPPSGEAPPSATTGQLPVVDPQTPPDQLGWAGPPSEDPPPAGS